MKKFENALLSLREKIIVDDKPYYFKSLIDKPNTIVSWKDIEYCLNSNNFVFDIVDDEIQIERIETFWEGVCQNRKSIADYINNGDGMILYNYHKHKGIEIIKFIEDIFPTTQATSHVYFGLDGNYSFGVHYDRPSNLIIQIEGKTHWKVFNNRVSPLTYGNYVDESELDKEIDVIMSPGDMLYIPSFCYHQATPSEKRISLSIPIAQLWQPQLDRNEYEINY